MVQKGGFDGRLHFGNVDQVDEEHLENVLFLEGGDFAFEAFEVASHIERLVRKGTAGWGIMILNFIVFLIF